MIRARTERIRQFILDQIERDPAGLSRQVQERFGITRQSAHAHLQALEAEGLIEGRGNTKARRYAARVQRQHRFNLPLAMRPQAEEVWTDLVAPRLGALPTPREAVLRFILTALVDNAVRHAGGAAVMLALTRRGGGLQLTVRDDGQGLFRKLSDDRALDDPNQAPLELCKGAAGASLLLAARAADHFVATANGLRLEYRPARAGWAMAEAAALPGTTLELELRLTGDDTLDAVRAEQVAPGGGLRTRVPVELLPGARDGLATPDQVRRLMAGLSDFSELWLDFRGVPTLAPAAAAALFRDWATSNPRCRLRWLKAAPAVEATIRAALGGAQAAAAGGA
ncbi:MAG: hypothetical protein H6693_13035 [Candidatus Latescibacteria bacterium]|nr:hypothetical protein [Candidatus Latescibacterota bacterium]